MIWTCGLHLFIGVPLSVHPARFTSIDMALLTYWVGYTIHHYHFSLDARILPNLANLEPPQNSSLKRLEFPCLNPGISHFSENNDSQSSGSFQDRVSRNHSSTSSTYGSCKAAASKSSQGPEGGNRHLCVSHICINERDKHRYRA